MCQYSLGPPITSTSSNHFDLLGRWSTSGSDRGIAHFFIATRNTIKGVGEKEQTNNMLGLIQAQEEKLRNIAFPMCICRLTLAWISSENFTTHEECWLILTALPSLTLGPYLMPTAHFCCLVSTGYSRHPSPSTFFEFPCPTPTRVPLPTSGHVEISSPKPLSRFAPKQTKESSAWRTTYTVLQINWKWVLLQQDSTRLHTVRMTRN